MTHAAELDFPPIDAGAPPSPQTAVATAAAQALDLEKMDLNAIVRSGFQPARDKAAEAVKTLTGVVHDLSTQAKVDAAKSLRHRLIGQPLADVRKLTKAVKSRLSGASKVAGEEEEKVEAAFAAADALITPQIEAREAELEAERQAKAQAEAERKAKHEANLHRLATAALRAREKGADSTEIAAGIEAMEAYAVTEAWEEFRERAEAARLHAIDALRTLHAEVVGRELQAAENERLRLLAEQQAAELAALRAKEAERLERERIADLEAGAPKPQDDEMVLVDAAAPLHQPTGPAVEACRPEAAKDTTQRGADQPTAAANAAGAGDDAKHAGNLQGPEEYTEGPGSQQVLKAEATTPDATDREIPADASPSGGAMGAGQPTAAGPAGVAPDSEMTAAWSLPAGPRVIFAEDEPEDELRTQTVAFVALVLEAFDTKFPTQPKPSVEWWAQVRQAGEALRDKLGEEGA